MIDSDALLKILSVFIVGLISPGPDFMLVSSNALAHGRLAGVKTAAGIATVVALYTVLCLTGLAVLFDRYLWLMITIKICGGLYLLYLGIKMWRASFATPHMLTSPQGLRRKNAYLAGVLCCLTNPKAIAFFASIFALALTPTTDLATKTAIVIAVPATALAWFSIVAFGLSKPFMRQRYESWQKVIDRVTGTVLGLFGLKLLFSAKN